MYYDKKRKLYRETFTFEDKRYSLTSKTKNDLTAKIVLKKRDLDEGKRTITKNMTVINWSKQWLSVYKINTVAKSTLGTYRAALNHINSDIGGLMLKNVKPLNCQTVLNNMSGLSWSSLTNARHTMRTMFDSAVKNGLMIYNPASDLPMPNIHKGTHRALTESERAVFLPVCETNKYGLWCLIMYYCGLRPGETERIRGKDIDLKANVLHIDGTKTLSAVRDVPIPLVLAKRLSECKTEPFQFLFTNRNGNPINKTNRQRMWQSITKDMHIKIGGNTDYGKLKRILPPFLVADDFVPYCLRHDYATRLQAAGVPINVAKELMGHKSIEMTARIYTHYSKQAFENARANIDSFEG